MRIKFTALMVTAIAACISCFQLAEASNTERDKAFIRDFYVTYIRRLEIVPHPGLRDSVTSVGQHLTAVYYKEILSSIDSEDGPDSDPILDAQDYDSRWKSQLRVLKEGETQNARSYLVCFGKTDASPHALMIDVIDEVHAPKIRHIQAAPWDRCKSE